MLRFTIPSCRDVLTCKLFGQIQPTMLVRRRILMTAKTEHRFFCSAVMGVSTQQTPAEHYSGPFVQRFRAGAPAFAGDRCTLRMPRRTFVTNLFRPSPQKVKVDDLVYDTESLRYRGTIFGLPADAVVFYFKIFAGVAAALFVMYVFFKGVAWVSRFSPHTVARMGFVSGFVCCMIVYTMVIQIIRRVQISSNAVYNHSIALVLRNAKVREFLGQHPRTGAFKAYAATGGFKLPLLRRIRSGSYEFSDLLGLKPRRLQMIFVLKNSSGGREGVVYCDVRKESTGFMTSEKVYKSLAVTLVEASKKEKETVIVIGREEDVVDVSLLF